MKTLEDIEKDFLSKIFVGRLIRVVLKENLVIDYDNYKKRACVKPSKFPSNIISAQTGKFKHYEKSRGVLEFETINGYSFTVNLGQIENYSIQD